MNKLMDFIKKNRPGQANKWFSFEMLKFYHPKYIYTKDLYNNKSLKIICVDVIVLNVII